MCSNKSNVILFHIYMQAYKLKCIALVSASFYYKSSHKLVLLCIVLKL